jgi:hypothetical protein
MAPRRAQDFSQRRMPLLGASDLDDPLWMFFAFVVHSPKNADLVVVIDLGWIPDISMRVGVVRMAELATDRVPDILGHHLGGEKGKILVDTSLRQESALDAAQKGAGDSFQKGVLILDTEIWVKDYSLKDALGEGWRREGIEVLGDKADLLVDGHPVLEMGFQASYDILLRDLAFLELIKDLRIP